MPIHTLNAIPPLVQVGLHVSDAYEMQGFGNPPAGGFTALLDTGATRTAIKPEILDSLDSQFIRFDLFRRPDGVEVRRETFAVRIAFEPDFGNIAWRRQVRWFDVIAVKVAPATQGVDLLIGQDLLAEVVMIWDGPRGSLLVTY